MFGDIEGGVGLDKGTVDKFKVETVTEEKFPAEGELQIFIMDESFNTKYAVTVANTWNTVKIDVSKLKKFQFYFSMNIDGTIIVSNPKLSSGTVTSVKTISLSKKSAIYGKTAKAYYVPVDAVAKFISAKVAISKDTATITAGKKVVSFIFTKACLRSLDILSS